MLLAIERALQLLHWQRQLVHQQVRCFAHRDQRSARIDELAQRLPARIAEPTAVLGHDGAEIVSFQHVFRPLVGENDRIESLAQFAGFDVGIV